MDYIKIILAMEEKNYSTIREHDPYSQTETSVSTLFHENNNAENN
jgi:hypothetical protein